MFSEVCCKSRSVCLQVFWRRVASVLERCCKSLFKMFQLFRVCCKRFNLDVAYVSHIYCTSMFEMFQLFQSYVTRSAFVLQVVIVLCGCCKCFPTMLQQCVLNVSSVR